MTPVRLGIVGVGKIARDQHLPTIAASDRFTLIAAADRKSSTDGVRNYSSLAAMLDAEPDLQAVSLCTPPAAREQDAILALSRGLHVLLEKPPAATVSAARAIARAATRASVCASWHSRHAPAVAAARDWLKARRVSGGAVVWKEDIRRWHPGQDWILAAGGMGVFDPGINAFSILTHIVGEPVWLTEASLRFPENRAAPIAAEAALRTESGARIAVAFDFLQQGEQIWDIRLDTDEGELILSEGGKRLSVAGAQAALEAPRRHGEYESVYARFADLIARGCSDFDLRPLELVADAFMCGEIVRAPAFHF